METFKVEGGQLELRVRGNGSPLVLVHGSVIADPWEPMLRYGDLLNSHQVVTFRRRGYGGSSPAKPGRTLSDEAADVVALLDHLQIDRSHVVGHSLAADIALQAVIEAPDRFLTMSLLEPGLFSVPSAAGFDEAMSPVVRVFESGEHQKAMLLFLGGVGGAEVMALLEQKLPEGTTEMALADVPTLFGSDLPAGSRWKLDEEAARALRHPALLAIGSKTGPIFRESNAALTALLANVEHLELVGSGHFIHVEQPKVVAERLAGFLVRNTPRPRRVNRGVRRGT